MKVFIALFALVAAVYAEAEAEAQMFPGAPVGGRRPNGFYYHVQTYDTPASTQLLRPQAIAAPAAADADQQVVAAVPNLYQSGLYHPYQHQAYNPYGAWNNAAYNGYAGYGGHAYGAYPYGGYGRGAWNNAYNGYGAYPYNYNNWYNAPRVVAAAPAATAATQ